MKLNISKNANYLGWIIIIIAIGFLYFSYFFIYIPKQENKLQQRAFRILKEYGNNMFGKNDYYKNHFENFKLYYTIRYNLESGNIAEKPDSLVGDKAKFKAIKNVVNGLYDYVDCSSGENEDVDSVFIYSSQENKLFLNYSAQMQNVTDSAIESSIQQLNNYYSRTSQKTLSSIKKDLEKKDTTLSLSELLRRDVMHKVPIDTFMSGLKFDRLFENIILFDTTRVYYNSRKELVSDITRPKALADSVETHQGGVWKTLSIRGTSKQLMVLPIDFLGKRFYFAGVISESEYKAKTRTIDNQLLILIAVLLLIVLIGMPILKILFIGKNERLKSTDTSASLISSIFGTGLVILMVIGIVKHQLVDHPLLEKRITQISDVLYRNVSTDINSIKNLYIDIKTKDFPQQDHQKYVLKTSSPYFYIFSSSPDSLPLISSINKLYTAEFYSDYFSRFSRFTKKSLLIEDKKFRMYDASILDEMLPINEVILINDWGKIYKAVTSTQFSELVPVDLSQRNYFKNAKDEALAWPDKNKLKFYIESIKSYNTGKGETSVSFHNDDWEGVPVTAITSSIPSLYKQVLPKDVEFVIVDNSGKVLYHSIRSKNLHENFLDECDFDIQLQKAMQYRTDVIFHVGYNERDWLARIVPFEDAPLFHITLIDLSYLNNRNARTFLFTFYFLIVTMIVIGIGMLILRWLDPGAKFDQQRRWFLSWVLFEEEKYLLYEKSSIILAFIIVLQFLSNFIINKPTAVLIYQVIFISFSSFVALIILKRKELKFLKLIKKAYFPENIILLIILGLQVLYIYNFAIQIQSFIPIIAVGVLATFLPGILKRGSLHSKTKDIDAKAKKSSYLLFMFLWLISLSIVPVIQFYYSIKYQEEQISKQEEFFTIAEKNLDLFKDFQNFEGKEWFKRIQGNGIDFLKVEYLKTPEPKIPNAKDNEDKTIYDRIYASLPDPVTNSFDKSIMIKNTNLNHEWVKNGVLYYTKGGAYGAVSVESDGEITEGEEWNLIFYLVIVIIGMVLWIMLKYISSVILNLNMENPKVVKTQWIDALFNRSSTNRFLLQSFKPEYFFEKTADYIKNNPKYSIVILKASQLADEKFNVQNYLNNTNTVLWIGGLEQFIYEVHRHELLLTRLLDINQYCTGKIVVEIPFDLDFIDEIYDDYISENELEKDKKAQYTIMKRRWKPTFKNYVEYNGYINAPDTEKISEHEEEKRLPCESDFIFSFIWNNLTNYEKIVLYDLADDGLVNIKNKPMIDQLYLKNLITIKPYPRFNSEEFKEFILHTLSPASVKTIEGKLGFKGKWKNTRYLILLILVPLAAFILISQGLSIEKIFAIFAGILTVITGVMRLFDSNIFKQASS